MVVMGLKPVLWRRIQNSCKVEANLGCGARPCVKMKINKYSVLRRVMQNCEFILSYIDCVSK